MFSHYKGQFTADAGFSWSQIDRYLRIPSGVGEAPVLLAFSPDDLVVLRSHGSISLPVAMTPQVAGRLALMGAKYLVPEDFYSISIFRDIDRALLDHQLKVVLDADAALSFDNKVDGVIGCRRGFESALFEIKILSDTSFREKVFACGLSRLVRERSNTVVAGPGRGCSSEQSLARALVLGHLASEGIHVDTSLNKQGSVFSAEATRSSDAASASSPRGQWVKPLLKRPISMTNHYAHAYGVRAGLRLFVSMWRGGGLFYEPSPDIEPMMVALRNEGFVARPFPRVRVFQNDALEPLERVLTASGLIDIVTWGSEMLDDVARSALRTRCLPRVDQYHDLLPVTTKALRDRQINGVVIRSPVTATDYAWLAGAQDLGIPTFSVQHGGFEGNCAYSLYIGTDLNWTDYRLVYGPGTQRYLSNLSKTAPQPLGEPIVTGSPRLERVWKHFSATESTYKNTTQRDKAPTNEFLYIATSYQYRWYAAQQSYFSTDYFNFLHDVVRALSHFDGAPIRYRAFPESPEDPVSPLIRASKSGVIVEDISRPLLDSYAHASAFIIDIPSTALLEILPLKRPVLLLADARCIELHEEARMALRQRVWLAESQSDFLRYLPKFLAEPFDPDIDLSDNSFVNLYGDNGFGISSDRVGSSVISSMIRGEPRA